MAAQPISISPHLLELLTWRRDVRHFQERSLDPGSVEALIDAVDLAPSVGLSQPWRLVAVEHPDRRGAIASLFERCNKTALESQSKDRATIYARLKLAGLKDAPFHLAVFADEQTEQGHGLGRQTMPETLAYSAVMAIHTLWLAARSIGVGVGWVSILDPTAVNGILDVPPTWRFIAYLCIGYPETESDVPELEREGWERRRPTELIRR